MTVVRRGLLKENMNRHKRHRQALNEMPDIITANVGPDLVSTWTLTVLKLDFICFVFILLLLKWLTLRVFTLVLPSFPFGVQIIVHITLCCHITLPLLLCIILSCSSWASSQSRTPLSKLSIRLSAVRSTPGQNSHMTHRNVTTVTQDCLLFAFCFTQKKILEVDQICSSIGFSKRILSICFH